VHNRSTFVDPRVLADVFLDYRISFVLVPVNLNNLEVAGSRCWGNHGEAIVDEDCCNFATLIPGRVECVPGCV